MDQTNAMYPLRHLVRFQKRSGQRMYQAEAHLRILLQYLLASNARREIIKTTKAYRDVFRRPNIRKYSDHSNDEQHNDNHHKTFSSLNNHFTISSHQSANEEEKTEFYRINHDESQNHICTTDLVLSMSNPLARGNSMTKR